MQKKKLIQYHNYFRRTYFYRPRIKPSIKAVIKPSSKDKRYISKEIQNLAWKEYHRLFNLLLPMKNNQSIRTIDDIKKFFGHCAKKGQNALGFCQHASICFIYQVSQDQFALIKQKWSNGLWKKTKELMHVPYIRYNKTESQVKHELKTTRFSSVLGEHISEPELHRQITDTKKLLKELSHTTDCAPKSCAIYTVKQGMVKNIAFIGMERKTEPIKTLKTPIRFLSF